MIKVAGGQELSKKNSVASLDQENVIKVLALYKAFLEANKSFDLSISVATNSAAAEKKYDLILVDESQDLSKTQLEHIYSLLSENGKIYYLMDGNQNLVDTFNLTPQYVFQIAGNTKEYSLNTAYRTPKNVTKLANKIIELKAHAVGGKLNKHEQQSALSAVQSYDQSSEDDLLQSNVDEDGSVEWIDMQNTEQLAQLKTEAASSIECVIIIADESCRQNAEIEFPEGMIFTAEQIKGEEFAKVILFNFFSEKYEGNNFYNAGECYDANKPTPSYHPKDLTNAHYAKPFNKLFVAVTRATKGVVFVETQNTSKSNKDAKALYRDILASQLQGTSSALEASSLENVMQRITSSSTKWDTDLLLKFVAKATDLMHKDALSNSSTKTNQSEYLEHLNNLKAILTSRDLPSTSQDMQNIEGLLVRFTPEESKTSSNSLNSLSSPSSLNPSTSTTEEESKVSLSTSTSTTEENKNSKPTKKKKTKKKKTSPDSNNSQENKDTKAQKQMVVKNLKPKEKADILKRASKLFDALEKTPDLLEHKCDGTPLLELIWLYGKSSNILKEATKNQDFVKAISFESLFMKNTRGLSFFEIALRDPNAHELLAKRFELMIRNEQLDEFIEYLNEIDVNLPDKHNQTYLLHLFTSTILIEITKILLSKKAFIDMMTEDGLNKISQANCSAIVALFKNFQESSYEEGNDTLLKDLFIKHSLWKKISPTVLNGPAGQQNGFTENLLAYISHVSGELIDIVKILLFEKEFLHKITQNGLNQASKGNYSALHNLIGKFQYEDILPDLVKNDVFLNLLTSKGINSLNPKGYSCLHELSKEEDLRDVMIILATKDQFINLLTLEGMTKQDADGKSFLDYLEKDANTLQYLEQNPNTQKLKLSNIKNPDIKPLKILLKNDIFISKIGNSLYQKFKTKEWYEEEVASNALDNLSSNLSTAEDMSLTDAEELLTNKLLWDIE